ncbi:MAG: hypothetical protein KME42_05535 [Tildeniella nuda ZEHNDER 1965/U140]|nr:hypothetical protein [Tildeniella nuda ZEHNDER 1965/U140]
MSVDLTLFPHPLNQSWQGVFYDGQLNGVKQVAAIADPVQGQIRRTASTTCVAELRNTSKGNLLLVD